MVFVPPSLVVSFSAEMALLAKRCVSVSILRKRIAMRAGNSILFWHGLFLKWKAPGLRMLEGVVPN